MKVLLHTAPTSGTTVSSHTPSPNEAGVLTINLFRLIEEIERQRDFGSQLEFTGWFLRGDEICLNVEIEKLIRMELSHMSEVASGLSGSVATRFRSASVTLFLSMSDESIVSTAKAIIEKLKE